jgi:heme exporter protein B
MSGTPSLFEMARLQMVRDLRLALRRGGEWLQPLVFFLVITTLFPLTFDSQLSRLRDVAPAALWVSALLSSLLALELLFRDDALDGTLEQLAVSGTPLSWVLLAKTAVHWLLTGLPLVLMAPVVAGALGAPYEAIPGLLLPLALGSITLSLIGAIGAALTLGLRRGGVLLGLLTLPLTVPVMIFGAGASVRIIAGQSAAGPLYLLAAVAVLALALAPLAIAAAVRINVE